MNLTEFFRMWMHHAYEGAKENVKKFFFFVLGTIGMVFILFVIIYSYGVMFT